MSSFFNSLFSGSQKDVSSPQLPKFKGESLEIIGSIPPKSDIALMLDSESQHLIIQYTDTIKLAIPYPRILHFWVEPTETSISEVSESAKMAGQLLSSGILGQKFLGAIGKVAGDAIMSQTNIQTSHWIGVLTYKNKLGDIATIRLIEKEHQSYYTDDEKSSTAIKFEQAVNEVAYQFGENTTEL